LVGFEQHKQELDALDAQVVAASVDALDKAQLAAADVSFPVGYGVTRDMADRLGSWWEERRGLVQPSDFIVDADGKVIASTYSSGPIGRMDAADVVRLIKTREAQK
jgi:alkyl hydroperoxide reductase subunit AhpC